MKTKQKERILTCRSRAYYVRAGQKWGGIENDTENSGTQTTLPVETCTHSICHFSNFQAHSSFTSATIRLTLLKIFKKDLSTIYMISGSRNCTISTISGCRNLLVNFLQFLDPETAVFLWFLDTETAPFLQFVDPEFFWSIFTISGSRNCSIFAVSGSRNCTISAISGSSNEPARMSLLVCYPPMG